MRGLTEKLKLEPGYKIIRIVEERYAPNRWTITFHVLDALGAEFDIATAEFRRVSLVHPNGRLRFFGSREDARFIRSYLAMQTKSANKESIEQLKKLCRSRAESQKRKAA